MTTVLTGRFRDALAWAVAVHDGQVRKGADVPYASHLLAVASLVLEYGGDEDQAIGALLHDALEDQPERAPRDEIARRFGARVLRIVEGCTDGEPDRATGRKTDWSARKIAYVAHLQHAGPDVLLVSACDKLHNARAVLADYRVLGEALWERFRGGRDGTLWYYRRLAEVLGEVGPPRVAAELRRTVDEIDRLAAGG